MRKDNKFSLKLDYKEGLFLIISFFLALFIRISFSHFIPVITTDGVYYCLLGKIMATQGLIQGFSPYWSPGLSFLIGIVYFFTKDLEFAGRLVCIYSGSLLVVPIYLLGRNFYSAKVGWQSVVITLVHPFLIFFSINVYAEGPYTLTFATAILLFWGALRVKKTWYYFLSATCAAFLFLLRPEALGFFLMFLVLVAAQVIMLKQHKTRRLINLLVLLVAFFLVISPYMFFLKEEMGQWNFTGLRGRANADLMGREGWYSIDPHTGITMADFLYAGRTYEQTNDGRSSGLKTAEIVKSDLVKSKKKYLEIFFRSSARLRDEFTVYFPQLVPILMMVFVAAGFFDEKWNRQRLKKEAYLLGIVIMTCVGYSLVHVIPRYLVPLLSVFIIWCAYGINRVVEWAVIISKRAWVKKYAYMVIVFLMLLVFAPKYVRTLRGDFHNKEIVYKEMGGWIKGNRGEGLTIMSLKPMTAFYAEGDHIYLPWADYQQTIDYARENGVDIIAVDEYALEGKRPEVLHVLLDTHAVADDLVTIFKTSQGQTDHIRFKK